MFMRPPRFTLFFFFFQDTQTSSWMGLGLGCPRGEIKYGVESDDTQIDRLKKISARILDGGGGDLMSGLSN